MKRLIRKLFYTLTRPLYLKSFGDESIINFPRILKGRKCISVGTKVTIAPHSWIEGFRTYANQSFTPVIEIGNNTAIGRYCTITAIDKVQIGENCLLSEYVYISDHMHDVFGAEPGPLVERELIPKGPVKIGDQCFIGFRAIIMPGVSLGCNCVVGAGSVVTKSFPENSIVAGVPARLIRKNT